MTSDDQGTGEPRAAAGRPDAAFAPFGDSRPLDGLRVMEGSAFVAAPLGGMTLAQLGADVIRFDTIGGGIDYHRWPCTPDGTSLFWASMNRTSAPSPSTCAPRGPGADRSS